MTMPWSQVEDRFLRDAWGHQSATEIGAFLDRSKSSVLGRAFRLGLSAPRQLAPHEVIAIRRMRAEARP
jgi:hypothetical protein